MFSISLSLYVFIVCEIRCKIIYISDEISTSYVDDVDKVRMSGQSYLYFIALQSDVIKLLVLIRGCIACT